MARNRKSQSAALRFGPALKASVLCLLIGGSGVGYVWQKDQLVRLCQQKKLRENRLEALELQNVRLRNQLAALYLPHSLGARAKQLGLLLPESSQVIYLSEYAGETPGTNVVRQFASQNQGSIPVP